MSESDLLYKSQLFWMQAHFFVSIYLSYGNYNCMQICIMKMVKSNKKPFIRSLLVFDCGSSIRIGLVHEKNLFDCYALLYNGGVWNIFMYIIAL